MPHRTSPGTPPGTDTSADTAYTHAPGPLTTAAVVGTSARFPVRRVYCVGRNYAEHAIEMGADPTREAPFFFCKPTDAVLPAAHAQDVLELPYPSLTENLHFEVELVVAIGRGGRDIAVSDAPAHIYGYAVGLDMTRRDLQQVMRQAGRPWEIGKTFEHCAPLGPLHRKPAGEPALARGAISLDVDGVRRQQGDIGQLIWSVPEIIADLSRYFVLAPGDLIFTGTPAGVGPVQPGHTLRAAVEGLDELTVRVVAAA